MEHLLAERVKEIMEDQDYSPSGFADTIDVPRPIISHILSGRNKPSLDVIQKILMRFPELNPWWLLSGKGNMKQLSLFSEEELESVSLKPTVHKHASNAPIAVPHSSKTEELPILNDQPVESPVAHKIVEPERTAPANPVQAPAAFLGLAQSQGKTIEKMMVFYSDKTFAVYHPE